MINLNKISDEQQQLHYKHKSFDMIIKNKLIFRKILGYITYDDRNNCNLTRYYSIDWLVENGFGRVLKYKVLNDCYLSFEGDGYFGGKQMKNIDIILKLFKLFSTNKYNKLQDLSEFYQKLFKNYIMVTFKEFKKEILSFSILSNNKRAFKELYNYYYQIEEESTGPFKLLTDEIFKEIMTKINEENNKYISNDDNNQHENVLGVERTFIRSLLFIMKKDGMDKQIEIKTIWKRLRYSLVCVYDYYYLNSSPRSRSLSTTQFAIQGTTSIPSYYNANSKFYKFTKPMIKTTNYLINEKRVFSTDSENLLFHGTFYQFDPIVHNFKVKLLYNLCLTHQMVEQNRKSTSNYSHTSTYYPKFMLSVEQLRSMVFLKSESESKLSDVINGGGNGSNCSENIKTILQMFLKIRKSTKLISSPCYYYLFNNCKNDIESTEDINYEMDKDVKSHYNGVEITALKYGSFKLFKQWFIQMSHVIESGNDCKSYPDDNQFYLLSHVKNSNKLGSVFKNIVKGITTPKEHDNCRIISSNSRLHEIIKGGVLFKYCTNKEHQVSFVTQVCNEILDGSDQFKLHPIIFLQMLIEYNDHELVSIVLSKLSKLLETCKSPKSNSAISKNQQLEQELEYYSTTAMKFKSFKIVQILYKFFQGTSRNFYLDWSHVVDLYRMESKDHLVMPAINLDDETPENKFIYERIQLFTDCDYWFYKIDHYTSKNYKEIQFKNIKSSHLKYIELIIKNNTTDSVVYHLDCIVNNFQNLNPIISLEFFKWLYNYYSCGRGDETLFDKHIVLSDSNKQIFKYLVYSFIGNNDGLAATLLFKYETVQQFFTSNKLGGTANQWSWFRYVFEFGDLNMLKLIINQFYPSGILPTPYPELEMKHSNDLGFMKFMYQLILKNHQPILDYLHRNYNIFLTSCYNVIVNDEIVNTVFYYKQ